MALSTLTASARDVTTFPHYSCLCLQVFWCLAAFGVTDVTGVTTWTPGWLAPPPCLRFPGLQASPSQGDRGVGGARVTGTFGVVRFTGVTAAGRDLDLQAPPWLEGQDYRPHCCCSPAPCGCVHCWGWEATGMCATSPAATGFSGAAGSAVAARGPGSQSLPPLFPQFSLLYEFQSTHL